MSTWLLAQCTGGELWILAGKHKKAKYRKEEKEGRKQENLRKKVVQNTRAEGKLVRNSPSCGFPDLKRRWIYFISLCVVCFCPPLQLAATFQPWDILYYMHMCIYIYTHTYICTYIHTLNIFMCMCAYIYTHMHIFIYRWTLIYRFWGNLESAINIPGWNIN